MSDRTKTLDAVFRALADPTRRAMVQRLAQGERSVTDLAEPFEMSLNGASKHIKVLESAGIITRAVKGRRHMCRLNPEPLSDARQWLEHYERFWNQRLNALEALLREDDDQPHPPPDTSE